MRLKTFTLCFFMISGLFTAKAGASVWETTAEWNDAAEANYRAWVTTNWNKDYFNQEGPLKGAIMDCADVIYSMRILYAAQSGLPFKMKDPTTRAGSIISNEMTRWDNRPPEQRLRNFVQLVHGVSSTASVPNDTYPTEIKPATLGAGSVILTDPEKHHSWTIQNFSHTGIPYLLFGSRPARTLLYERNEYPSVGFVFPQGIRPETNAGFRNFRQPADIGKPVSDVPGFSLEQYSIPAQGFMKTVQKRMQKIEETPQQHVVRVFTEACRGARERVDIVRDGVRKNLALGATCMNAQQYDDFSTPSKDLRMKETFKDLENAYNEAILVKGALNDKTRKQVEAVINGSTEAGSCPIAIAPGTKLSLGQVYTFSVEDKLSNNPHDTLEMRWGLEAAPSAKAQGCPIY